MKMVYCPVVESVVPVTNILKRQYYCPVIEKYIDIPKKYIRFSVCHFCKKTPVERE